MNAGRREGQGQSIDPADEPEWSSRRLGGGEVASGESVGRRVQPEPRVALASRQGSATSCNCGGAWASGRGGSGWSRPRLRSTNSAVRGLVTRAMTRRRPPQPQTQTSQPNVRCSNVAQSSRLRLGLAALAGRGGARGSSRLRQQQRGGPGRRVRRWQNSRAEASGAADARIPGAGRTRRGSRRRELDKSYLLQVGGQFWRRQKFRG